MKPTGPRFPRRVFLQSLSLPAVLALPGAAAQAFASPWEFAVVSDTHLGRKDQPTAAQHWATAAKALAQSSARFVLHLGDLVDRGRRDQYPLYRTIRDRIGKPVWEVPGNHDPLPLFTRYVRNQVDLSVELGPLQLLLVNNSRTDSHQGFLSSQQLAWIQQQCEQAARRRRFLILAMHVPVHTNLHPDRGWYVHPGQGQRRLYRLVRRYQDRILALFHGHFHCGLRGWSDHAPVHEVVFPSLLYNRDRRLKQQGAPGYNPAEFRPGYVLVRLHRAQMVLRYVPLGQPASVTRELKLPQFQAG